MAGRKKTFPCGHTGQGQYCHRCAQEEKRRREEEEERQRLISAKKEMSDRLSKSPIPLDHVPTSVADRTLEVIVALSKGAAYQSFKGKRLVTMGQRDVVSIPIGRRYRLICRHTKGPLQFLEIISHETYNNRLSSGGWEG